MTGLSIISYIYDKLKNDQDLSNYVHRNIYPIVVEEGVKGNYITLQKTNVNPIYNKDGYFDQINFSVKIYSLNYKTTVEIAEIVRNILENLNMRLESVSENFSDDLYFQQLNFTTKYIMK